MSLPVCSLCVIRGIASGSGFRPKDGLIAKLAISPRSGDEAADFDRDGVVFEATKVVTDDVGGFSAEGFLSGPFGVYPDREVDEPVPATLEAYARNGEVDFVQIEVPGDENGPRFVVSFKQSEKQGTFVGTAFMSRSGEMEIFD